MIKKNKNLLKNARELRKEMTKQERRLWYDFLRFHSCKFYKQKIIGNYIADFYCHRAKLVIEIDGSQHYEADGIEYDKKRTEFLNSLNITVLRFTNIDIDKNFNSVCEYINQFIENSPLSHS